MSMDLSCWYYLRNEENEPVVTVILTINDNNEIARGVSVCSVDDNPEKRKGIEWARKYAIDAMKAKSNIERKCLQVESLVLDSVSHPEEFDIYAFKAWYMPKLSEFETNLINKAIKRVEIFSKKFNYYNYASYDEVVS